MTKKIASDLSKADGNKSLKVLIDGPYGACHDVARYDTVVLFVEVLVLPVVLVMLLILLKQIS